MQAHLQRTQSSHSSLMFTDPTSCSTVYKFSVQLCLHTKLVGQGKTDIIIFMPTQTLPKHLSDQSPHKYLSILYFDVFKTQRKLCKLI